MIKPTTSVNALRETTNALLSKPKSAHSRVTSMSLGVHNNTKSGAKPKPNVGFYVSNTSDIDKFAIKSR